MLTVEISGPLREGDSIELRRWVGGLHRQCHGRGGKSRLRDLHRDGVEAATLGGRKGGVGE